MMQRRTFLGLAALAAVAPSSSLGCSTPQSRRVEQGPVIADLTANVILPSLRDVDAKAAALASSAASLRDAPAAESLAGAQKAWRAAHAAWRRTDVLSFGPVITKDIGPSVAFWPANPGAIDAVVAGADPLGPEAVGKLGANAKGLKALEYLLFDAAGGDAAVLASLTGEGPGARRRTLAALTADALRARTSELLRAWEPAGEDFAQKVTAAGQGSSVYGAERSVIDELVNQMIFAVEAVVQNKLAKPLGKSSGGAPQPALEEAPRSDASLDAMLATLGGVESVYTGTFGETRGKGISSLVSARSRALDDRARAALEAAAAAVRAVPPPMRTALAGDRAPLEAAYEATNALKKLLATEIASALGTTLKFGDNDGD